MDIERTEIGKRGEREYMGRENGAEQERDRE